MSVTVMKPKTQPKTQTPEKSGALGPAESEKHHPLLSLREEIDRLFDNAFSHTPFKPFGRWDWNVTPFKGDLTATLPKADVVENKKAFTVTVELPGMEEKDVEVTLTDHMLTIQGESRREHKEDDDSIHLMERHYGKIRRTLRVPEGIDEKKVDAHFENGLLSVTLAKTKAVAPKKIPVKTRVKKTS